MAKESFIIYKSFYEPIKYLNNEQLGKLFRTIFEYQINKTENVDDDIRMAFEFFKNQFRLDDEKYKKIVERNKLNGKKGGRPKNPEEPKKPTGLFENPEEPKKADNDNENETDNKNVNINNNNINNIYELVENNFGRTLSPLEIEQIDYWLEEYEPELLKHAIKIAVLNNAKNFNYVRGILNNWKSKGIKTLNEVLEPKIEKENDEIIEIPDYDWLNEEG